MASRAIYKSSNSGAPSAPFQFTPPKPQVCKKASEGEVDVIT